MEELESQIAKIQLGGSKNSSSYVYTLAEKAGGGPAELYMVAELPLLNPAAEESCERICQAIAGSLKRAYRRQYGDEAFENAISQANEELGKLASMGQTHWIDKLNCILAVKSGDTFYLASCGKVSAYLLRNREYTDISCSPAKSHPLKTFETYASGKIRLGDLLILSTTQLFNYLSTDRLLNIVDNADFLTATKTIIELLKENAEPQVAFGVLLNLQVPLGQTPEEGHDLENYAVETNPGGSWVHKATGYFRAIFALDKKVSRVPQTNLPKISLGQKIKNLGGDTRQLLQQSKNWWQRAKSSAKVVRSTVNTQNFKALSPQKKFFFTAACILLVAVIVNVYVAARVKNTRKITQQVNSQLTAAQTLLGNAQASLLYKDDAGAAKYFNQAKSQMPEAKSVDASNQELYKKVLAQLTDTENQMEHIVEPQVANLGNLGQGGSLIRLPEMLAVQTGQSLVSYSNSDGKIEDSALKSPVTIAANAWMSGTTAAVYDGTSLYQWNYATGKTGAAFAQSVPAQDQFGGLAQYPVNNRVYAVDKQNMQIVNFLPAQNTFSRPVVSVRDPGLAQAMDMAIGIDGSIYVLEKSGVAKFQAGHLASFTMPYLSPAFSGSGRIYTQQGFSYLYVLDAGNNRVLVLDKSGALNYTLKSDQFVNLKDLAVDEKNKTLYLLSDGNLLKVSLP
ncbi:MAG TPA: hypothetical protein VHA30_00430 [Patescibacteria group bacterium]|nr:hypothetical protein [Patescibacteria group bacterium]